MSHHLVTVCMFCLLCAAHTCGSHIDKNEGIVTYDHNLENVDHSMIDLEERRKADSKLRYHQKLQKIRHKDRSKRELKEDTNAYVEKIFHRYGNVESMTMNLTGFNKMLEELKLHQLIEGGKTVDSRSYVYSGSGGNDNDEVKVSGIYINIVCRLVQDLARSNH